MPDIRRLRPQQLTGLVTYLRRPTRDPALAVRDALLSLAASGVQLEYEGVLEWAYRRLLKPGDVVVDVGAHTGRHAVVFDQLVAPGGQVIALEPLPDARAALIHRTAGSPTVRVLPFAASSSDGEAQFVHAVGTPEESGLRQRSEFNRPDLVRPVTITVETRRLDSVLGDVDNLRYVKLDIEGGELDCLQGAQQTLTRFRPLLSVEYGYPGYSAYGHTRGSLPAFAASIGYVPHDLWGNPLDGPGVWDQVCDAVYWDYFLVPKERLDDLSPLRH